MKKQKTIYWVDFPDPNSPGNWVNVATFDTRKEAIDFLEDEYGISRRVAHVFVCNGEV